MAVTTLVGKVGSAIPSAALHITKLTVAMSASYSTGGEVVDHELDANGNIPLASVRHVTFGLAWKGFTPIWDAVNKKVVVERTGAVNAAREEAPVTTDLSTVTAGEMFIHHD